MEQEELLKLHDAFRIEQHIKSVTVTYMNGEPTRYFNASQWCLFRKRIIQRIAEGICEVEIEPV